MEDEENSVSSVTWVSKLLYDFYTGSTIMVSAMFEQNRTFCLEL